MSDFNLNRYLGDGVYISHDGYQFWLAVNDHENKVVALDPDVAGNLINYLMGASAHFRDQRAKAVTIDDLAEDGLHADHD